MFCGSHSGLSSRTSSAVVELMETAPHAAHLRLLGTVILGPSFPIAENKKAKKKKKNETIIGRRWQVDDPQNSAPSVKESIEIRDQLVQ